jgi:hypothetical protein
MKFKKKAMSGEGGDHVALDVEASVTCHSVKSVYFPV